MKIELGSDWKLINNVTEWNSFSGCWGYTEDYPDSYPVLAKFNFSYDCDRSDNGTAYRFSFIDDFKIISEKSETTSQWSLLLNVQSYKAFVHVKYEEFALSNGRNFCYNIPVKYPVMTKFDRTYKYNGIDRLEFLFDYNVYNVNGEKDEQNS